MGKGSSPSGNTTTTQTATNPTATAQLPYLQNLWGAASNQMGNPAPANPWNIGAAAQYAQDQAWNTGGVAGQVMPAAMWQYLNQINAGIPSAGQAGQLTANAGNAVNQGLGFSQGLAGAANSALGQVPGWQNAFMGAGQQANNTLQGYGSAVSGLAPGALGGMSSLAGAAAMNPAFNSALGGLASGAYINPSTNPAYASMIQNATQPLVNQYMTATAPQLASQFEGAGRYGSGAQINAQGQQQYGLGQGLGNAISNITNNAYNTGLQATLGGAQEQGNIYNQAISNAGNIYNQGYSTAGNLLNAGGGLANQGYNALNAFMGNAAGQGLGYLNAGLTGQQAAAQAAQAGYGTANTALTGAGTLLNQGNLGLTSALSQAAGFAGYPQSEYTAAYNLPWTPTNNMASILGGAVPGGGTQTTSQPYFSNTGANILGGLTGGLGIANMIGGGAGAMFPGAISSGLAALGPMLAAF